MPNNRFSNAMAIQQGACNLSGITHALMDAIKDCRAENLDVRNDVAIRLIIHQMAYLVNIDEFDHSLFAYDKALTECQERSNANG